MGAGRPQKADPGTLYTFAHQFYWDFRRLAEGRSRYRFDKKKHQQLVDEMANLQLNDEQKTRYQQIVDEEIQAGRLKETERVARLRDLEDGGLFATRAWAENIAVEESARTVKVPGEPDVINALLDRKTTPERVRALCRDAFMSRKVEVESGVMKDVEVSAWPIAAGSTLPTYLSQYADEYIEALRDPRFPRCDVSTRPSTRLKQFWFLSRALAGALFGVTTRTAINLVGSMRPEQVFSESRDGKPARNQRKRRQKS
jgi:hypothetical protein